MINRVEEEWQTYRTKCLPPCLNPDAVARIREAFFAGALANYTLAIKSGEMPPQQGIDMMNQVGAELAMFADTMTTNPYKN